MFYYGVHLPIRNLWTHVSGSSSSASVTQTLCRQGWSPLASETYTSLAWPTFCVVQSYCWTPWTYYGMDKASGKQVFC